MLKTNNIKNKLIILSITLLIVLLSFQYISIFKIKSNISAKEETYNSLEYQYNELLKQDEIFSNEDSFNNYIKDNASSFGYYNQEEDVYLIP